METEIKDIRHRLEEATKTILVAIDTMHRDFTGEMRRLASAKVSYHDFYVLEDRVETLEKEGEDE